VVFGIAAVCAVIFFAVGDTIGLVIAGFLLGWALARTALWP
jgi:hypothetical protein